jgi:hypothetical protein
MTRTNLPSIATSLLAALLASTAFISAAVAPAAHFI